jgi:predicted TIM-barrel fold metal-dependent hydrolase
MPGIRLHPNYHGYELTDPVFAELLHVAAANGLIVQLVVSMEDIRTQHPLMRVPPVDLSPLTPVIKSQPSTRLLLLNWWPALRGERIRLLADSGEVYFDLAMLEGIEGVARLVEQLPPERILFGSNSPLFYFEAALLKLQESGLPEGGKTMLFDGNARRILPPKV